MGIYFRIFCILNDLFAAGNNMVNRNAIMYKVGNAPPPQQNVIIMFSFFKFFMIVWLWLCKSSFLIQIDCKI